MENPLPGKLFLPLFVHMGSSLSPRKFVPLSRSGKSPRKRGFFGGFFFNFWVLGLELLLRILHGCVLLVRTNTERSEVKRRERKQKGPESGK